MLLGGSKSKRYMGCSRKEAVGWERVESCSRLLYKNWPMMDMYRPGNIRNETKSPDWTTRVGVDGTICRNVHVREAVGSSDDWL